MQFRKCVLNFLSTVKIFYGCKKKSFCENKMWTGIWDFLHWCLYFMLHAEAIDDKIIRFCFMSSLRSMYFYLNFHKNIKKIKIQKNFFIYMLLCGKNGNISWNIKFSKSKAILLCTDDDDNVSIISWSCRENLKIS